MRAFSRAFLAFLVWPPRPPACWREKSDPDLARLNVTSNNDKGPVSRASGVASHTTVTLQDGSFKSGGCSTMAARQSANDGATTIAKTPAHIGVIPFLPIHIPCDPLRALSFGPPERLQPERLDMREVDLVALVRAFVRAVEMPVVGANALAEKRLPARGQEAADRRAGLQITASHDAPSTWQPTPPKTP
jgi:hypothetical protein